MDGKPFSPYYFLISEHLFYINQRNYIFAWFNWFHESPINPGMISKMEFHLDIFIDHLDKLIYKGPIDLPCNWLSVLGTKFN